MPDAGFSKTVLGGDLAFLAKKEFDNQRVDVSSTGLTLSDTSTETTLVTQTASTGKDMYMAKASAETHVDLATGAFDVTARLYVNGVVVETLTLEGFVDTNGPDNMHTFNFKSTGDKVLTTQIIKITIQNSSGAASRRSSSRGKLILWEEDTGVDPTVI